MKKCNHCQVEIIDHTYTCPLCNRVLDNQNDEVSQDMYPDVESKEKGFIGLKNMFFILGILASAICVLVNALTYQELWWSAIVVGCIGYLMVTISYSILNHANPAAKIVVEVFVGCILTVLIDLAMDNHGWAFDYAVPGFIFVGSMAIVFMMILDRKEWYGYVIYELATVILAMVQLILTFTPIVEHPFVGRLCCITTIVVLLIIMTIGYRDGKNELIRRFRT